MNFDPRFIRKLAGQKNVDIVDAMKKTAGVDPIRFDKKTVFNIGDFENLVISSARWAFAIKGYTGLLTPWYDDAKKSYLWYASRKPLEKWGKYLLENDIDARTYCILSFLASDYTVFSRPGLLLCQRSHWSWLKKLRKYAESKERMNSVSNFMEAFINNQLLRYSSAYLDKYDFAERDPNNPSTKCFGVYHRIVNRICQLEEKNITLETWLSEKFMRFHSYFKNKPDAVLRLRETVDHNRWDPDFGSLAEQVRDEWYEIREFLSLPMECQFADGFIPKGWRPISDSLSSKESITKVKGDGFYYYKDGSQRRGRRHYSGNSYFIIKCDPSNFAKFKSAWDDPRLFSAKPSWEEYRNYALYPGLWNEEGLAVGLVKPRKVLWRRS